MSQRELNLESPAASRAALEGATSGFWRMAIHLFKKVEHLIYILHL